MKYSDTGFRAVYHSFTVFPLADGIRAALKVFPGEEHADSALKNINQYGKRLGWIRL